MVDKMEQIDSHKSWLVNDNNVTEVKRWILI